MKKIKVNSFDVFVDNLSKEFAEIRNFQLLRDDENGQKLFDFVANRFAEITSFKFLFLNSYLPAASKASVESWNEFQNSKYRHFVKMSREELKENYYETIMLGYIGMFHKYENYTEDLMKNAELLISESSNYQTPLAEYLLKTFNFNIKDWKSSPIISRLNWICICNKHYDGFPRKTPVPEEFSHFPKDLKLRLSKEDFVRDFDFLIDEYLQMLKLVFLLALHRMAFEGRLMDVVHRMDDKLQNDLEIAKQKFDESLRDIIKFRKGF